MPDTPDNTIDSTIDSTNPPQELKDGVLHCWWAHLDAFAPWLPRCSGTLAPRERARAQQLRVETKRRHFIVGRALLRTLLARYLETQPQALELDVEHGGKPCLLGANGRRICFNVSHSGAYALYAVARQGPLGVDVELLEAQRDDAAIARRYFAPEECAALDALPAERRRAAFYTAWTSKEALLKAHGIGLRVPLREVVVSVAPGQPGLLAWPSLLWEAETWRLHAISAPEGYVATAAAPTGITAVQQFHFVPEDIF